MSDLARRLPHKARDFIGVPSNQEPDMQAVLNRTVPASAALVQFALDMDDTPAASREASAHERIGLALGRGQTLQDAVREIGQVVESVQTADEVMRQARRHGIDLPISDRVRAVLHGEQTPEEGLRALLAREQKPEYPDTLFK